MIALNNHLISELQYPFVITVKGSKLYSVFYGPRPWPHRGQSCLVRGYPAELQHCVFLGGEGRAVFVVASAFIFLNIFVQDCRLILIHEFNELGLGDKGN